MMISGREVDHFESRFEKVLADQQATYQQTREDVLALKQTQAIIQRDVLSLNTNVEKLVARFEDGRKTNWPLLALLSGLLPLLLGGMTFVFTSYTAGAISPVQNLIVQDEANLRSMADTVRGLSTTQTNQGRDIGTVAQTLAGHGDALQRLVDEQRSLEEKAIASGEADVNSRTDREQLNQRVQKLEAAISSEVADRRSQGSSISVQLAQIEQQFHSVYNSENLRAAQQERLNSMVWEKSHPGERYPNGTFFPTEPPPLFVAPSVP